MGTPHGPAHHSRGCLGFRAGRELLYLHQPRWQAPPSRIADVVHRRRQHLQESLPACWTAAAFPQPLRHLRARRLADCILERYFGHEQARKAITYLMRGSSSASALHRTTWSMTGACAVRYRVRRAPLHTRAFCWTGECQGLPTLPSGRDLQGARESEASVDDAHDWHSEVTLEVGPTPTSGRHGRRLSRSTTACGAARRNQGPAGAALLCPRRLGLDIDPAERDLRTRWRRYRGNPPRRGSD